MKNTFTRTPALAAALVGLALGMPALSTSAGGEANGKVAHVNSVFGGLFTRTKGSWQPVKEGQDLPANSILVALPKAEVTSANGAVHLSMLADIGQRGPFPVLETGVILNPAKDADLDVTFERGIIVLTNLKKEGSAKVRLKARGEAWELTLQSPKSVIALEISSRHAPGLTKKLDKLPEPNTELLMLVLHGRVLLDSGQEALGLQAPPGLARVHWNSATKQHAVQRLEKLPDELIKPFDDKNAKLFKDISVCSKKLQSGDVGKTLDELLKSDDKCDRLAGITWAGALDDYPHLAAAMNDAKHADSRDHAILVLRHNLGRSSDQVKAMMDYLVKDKKVTPVQARSLIQLLIGFDAYEREQPDTYQLLIKYLEHSALPVRELARWHLVRLAPAGRDIAYDAAAPEADRRKAVARWEALIPEGQLPPEPKAEKKSEK